MFLLQIHAPARRPAASYGVPLMNCALQDARLRTNLPGFFSKCCEIDWKSSDSAVSLCTGEVDTEVSGEPIKVKQRVRGREAETMRKSVPNFDQILRRCYKTAARSVAHPRRLYISINLAV